MGTSRIENSDGLATVDRDDLHPLQAEAIRRMSPERRQIYGEALFRKVFPGVDERP